MEDFVVSARKYRPKNFDTVVGQESITRTLLKAVEQNQLAQAFLFCGPRGVGKTTCARILARTVNAHATGQADANEDYAFNIFELDAASNNSVDDIRSLIDQVRVPPQVGKYKVYIIDEVHMLSTAAFNAFLKTLEEPPGYAIFILATTEKHKVLPTILSRCQVFDFHRIQIPQMVSHLQTIAAKEGIDAESDALHIIAEKADGALRDALSIFDQMVSFSGKKVTYDDVITNLNVLDYDYYFSLVEYFLHSDRSSALITFSNIINKGFDAHNFVNGMANHFRNLLFCVDKATTALLEVGDNVRERYLAQAQACDVRFLLNGINILSDTDANYKNSRSQRLLVELALLKLCNLGPGGAEKKNDESHGLMVASEPPRASLTKAPAPAKLEIATASKTSPVADPEVTTIISPAVTVEKLLATADAGPTAVKEKTDAAEPDKTQQPSPVPADESSTNAIVPESQQAAGMNANASDDQEEDAVRSSEIAKHVAAPPSSHTEDLAKAENTPKPVSPSGFSSKLANRRSKGMPSLHDSGFDAQRQNPQNSAGEAVSFEEIARSPLTGERPSTPFNLAQLWEVWDGYAAEIREQDRQSYYATLTKRKPIMREANKIELVIDNHVQLSDLENDKINLLTHLRERLNNWHIQLTGIIEEEESGDDMHLYTPEERFKAMLETNPALGTLKQQFDLDVEHD